MLFSFDTKICLSTLKMQQVVFIIVYCVCFLTACQITISGGKFNSDVCKGYGELESKVDILTAKVDRSLQMLKTINELVKDNKPNNGVIKNVALKKRIQQSSWYAKTRSWGNYICCATEYANDGNATTFSHTNYENSPYLWVDLGHVYDIKRIEIINRSDHAGSRLHDVDITVGPTLNELSLCVHYKGPGKTKEHLVFHCNKQMRGRYVKVTIKGKEYLQLSEVMVFAPEISEYLKNVDIIVGSTLKEMSLCAHYKGPAKLKEHLIFHCNRQMSGRYVKVTIKAKQYLHLSEVMVFATEISE
ncbi:uncharacterized protein LOC143078505 [Mytilus galloprovincialis]|uniref:uncharacterized protein LOC143078505 n=1 Tax=Mytilus galloprovincialis TaxID=29158 RepID=UPI003F7CCB9C